MSQKTTEVHIKPAKGRPMLTWVGKRPLRNVTAYPAQLVETFAATTDNSPLSPGLDWSNWPQSFPKSGLLFHGDNKDVLAYLLANGFRGKVKLIYIDPPFDSGADYVRKVALRGATTKLDGEEYTVGEQVQYADIWANDNYLQFIYERLLLAKELLLPSGSIYLHCDWNRVHHLRCLMDEILGADNFRNEIYWRRVFSHNDTKGRFGIVTDTILFYSMSRDSTYNLQTQSHDEQYLKAHYTQSDEKGAYQLVSLNSPNPRPNLTYEYKGYPPPPNGWSVSRKRMEELDAQGLLYLPENKSQRIRIKKYIDQSNGYVISNIWDDLAPINSQAKEQSAYPTQKPESLLDRIIKASSDPGDIVIDFFVGSGTTATVAQRLGRRWIGCDVNKGAIQTSIKRLKNNIQEQSITLLNIGRHLPGLEDKMTTSPCQLSFSVYRVNDYDLQIQHNEAFNLAVEHLGMTRTKTDSFFDGTLGKRLVKIIPFNHPLTPLDLEEVKNELSNRPEESRDIAVVCLGKELAVDGWLEDWNRIRRKGDFPNKIEVIELRTDPRYGGFFVHEPAQAAVRFERAEGSGGGLSAVTVTVENFLSPTIIQRLEQQAGGPLVKAQITDWRAMVDSIMIDSNYAGQVFNITLADVPEKKSDLVKGTYRVDAPVGTTVAVKITDMLGEEILIIEQV